MPLQPSEAQAFYDHFGKKQDAQSFYEDPALTDLTAHARFNEAQMFFEFGCGTGRFAARLLSEQLPASARYLGIDVSSTMVDLARERLQGFSDRARVVKSDGNLRFPVVSDSVDRVVATYVIDLLSESDIEDFLREAYRALNTGGKLCLVSLTQGTTFFSRAVSSAWALVHRVRASLVGGCRPIRVSQYFDPSYWTLEYKNVVVAFGVPSEVIVARPIRSVPKNAEKEESENNSL
jgi:ubiquinone/menaquinone biosynthesis C-methylase UbiE